MIKNKIILSILACACFSFVPSIANAQVNGYLVKDNNTVYEYSVKDLIHSRLGDKKFFNEFQQHCSKFGLYAYKDDSGKIVSQDDTLKAFLNNRNNFNLNKFVESDKSQSIKIDNIKQVSVDSKTTSPDIKIDNNQDKTDSKQDNNKIDIEKLKQEIKTPEDLEKFLNQDSRFNQLETPIGTFNFETKVKVNNDKNKFSMTVYDLCIDTSWNNKVSPVDIATCKICNKKQARETATLMKNYQKQVADLALILFPNEKIAGNFLNNSKYQLDKLNKDHLIFYTWFNYDNPSGIVYGETTLTKFYWAEYGYNSFSFQDSKYKLYEN